MVSMTSGRRSDRGRPRTPRVCATLLVAMAFTAISLLFATPAFAAPSLTAVPDDGVVGAPFTLTATGFFIAGANNICDLKFPITFVWDYKGGANQLTLGTAPLSDDAVLDTTV